MRALRQRLDLTETLWWRHGCPAGKYSTRPFAAARAFAGYEKVARHRVALWEGKLGSSASSQGRRETVGSEDDSVVETRTGYKDRNPF